MQTRSRAIRRSSSLKRLLNLSFTFRNKRSSSAYCALAKDEQNIFCADLVSTNFIVDKLMEVQKNKEVTKLEVEDWLVSSHHALLPIIRSLVVSGKHEWQWIRFVDNLDLEDFAVWQQKEHAVMQDYENTIDDYDKFKSIISFNAAIRIEVDTPYYVVRTMLQSLQQDKSVTKVSLHCMQKTLLPLDLKEIVDSVSGVTTEEMKLKVISGWSDSFAVDPRTILDAFIRELQPPGETATDNTPSTRPRRPSDGVSAQAQLHKSRNSVRRTKSAESFSLSERPTRRNKSVDDTPVRRRTKSTEGSSCAPAIRRVKTEELPRQRRFSHRGDAHDMAAPEVKEVPGRSDRGSLSLDTTSQGRIREILNSGLSNTNHSDPGAHSNPRPNHQSHSLPHERRSMIHDIVSEGKTLAEAAHGMLSAMSDHHCKPHMIHSGHTRSRSTHYGQSIDGDTPDYDWSAGVYLDDHHCRRSGPWAA